MILLVSLWEYQSIVSKKLLSCPKNGQAQWWVSSDFYLSFQYAFDSMPVFRNTSWPKSSSFIENISSKICIMYLHWAANQFYEHWNNHYICNMGQLEFSSLLRKMTSFVPIRRWKPNNKAVMKVFSIPITGVLKWAANQIYIK